MLGTDLSEAVKLVRESHQHVDELLHGCQWRHVRDSGGSKAYREALTEAPEFLIKPEHDLPEGKATREQRFMFYSGRLAEAFSLCPADECVQDLLPDIRFFEAVRTSRRKYAMDEWEEQGLATAADVQLMIAQLNTSVVATEDELAFYEALAADPSAVEQMDGSLLARIAHELYEQIRRDVTVDWKVKEQVRDRIMARVLRLLRKYGYPPDKQPAAIERVLKQA